MDFVVGNIYKITGPDKSDKDFMFSSVQLNTDPYGQPLILLWFKDNRNIPLYLTQRDITSGGWSVSSY